VPTAVPCARDYAALMQASNDSSRQAQRAMEALGARPAAFAIGLDSTAPLVALRDGAAELPSHQCERLAALAIAIERLEPIWGPGGTSTCLWGTCRELDGEAAITALRDGDLGAFARAVEYYARLFYDGQGG
jgi:hypothetical protein